MNASRNSLEFDWSRIDANLRGPYQQPTGSRPVPFSVGGGTALEIGFARIRSGPAFPEFLPPIDRVVPLSGVAQTESTRASDASVVLSYLDEQGEWRALCTAESSVVHWRLNPLEWIQSILSEQYVVGWKRPLMSRIPLLNYARLHSSVKGALQQTARPHQGTPEGAIDFPQLPVDDFVDALRRLCAALCWGQQPELGNLWPDGRRAAITITHDVDTGWIFNPRNRVAFRQILDAETSHGFRGGWFIPAAFYHHGRHDEAVRELERAGHELGSHGWNHDTKLNYQSVARQQRRLARIPGRFSPRRIEGIRTPWYSRSPQLFEQLTRHFRYDSSVPNASNIFSTGSNSGCCTLFPYRGHDGLMELPLTLPPDDVFDPAAGYTIERDATHAIVERGGVIVVIFHPQPHHSANPQGIAHFENFLRWLRSTHGDQLFSATPTEIVKRYCERAGVDRTQPVDPEPVQIAKSL